MQFDLSSPAGSGRAACIRAIEEAAAYVVRGHLDIISELCATRPAELTFSGGAAKGSLWPQIIADVLGVPVRVPAVTESSALGAALCAGKGAGIYASLTDLGTKLRERAATFEPGPAVAAYNDSYASWQQIYQRMLALSDEGLLTPLWRAAGTNGPYNEPERRRHAMPEADGIQGQELLAPTGRRHGSDFPLKGPVHTTGGCRTAWHGCSDPTPNDRCSQSTTVTSRVRPPALRAWT